VILMDIQMPIMNGFDAMRALRDEGYHSPIFALTAHALHEERVRCLEAGFDDYIVKPVKRAAIIRKLSQFCRQGASAAALKRPPLSSIYEDDPIIGSLLGEFIARLPDRIAKIKAAFDADNFEELTR